MGKIPQGILGGVSGKIGGVVGSSWKGINVIKTKPLSVANPKTAGQVAQRDKFGNTVAFATQILSSIIKPLWDRFSGQMSGFNKFIQTNIGLFAAAMPSPYHHLIISAGRMSATSFVVGAIAALDEVVTITWNDDSGAGFKLSTDEAYIVVVNETQEVIDAQAADVTRLDEMATVSLSAAAVEGDIINTYLAFRRADGTVVSNSSGVTKTVTA